MDYIEKKQLDLIFKTKKYFKDLKQRGIDLSKSSFCYISTYGQNPGHTKLLLWLKKKHSLFFFFKIITIHILAISSFYNYKILNFKKKKYKNIILTWGRRNNFKETYYYDSFLSLRSDQSKNSLFFVISLDHNIPSIIPDNVVLFCKIKKDRSILFLFSEILKCFIHNNFNFLKIAHYLSSQTIFAKMVNKQIFRIFKLCSFEKIILPYEGQPFQNYLLNNFKKKTSVKTLGIVHSVIPALPLNFMKREGSPDKLYISGKQQKNVLTNHFGWKNSEIHMTESLRLKKKLDQKIIGSIFLPINLSKSKLVVNIFTNFLIDFKNKLLPVLKVRNHPQMINSHRHIKLETNLNKILKNNKKKFNYKTKLKVCLFIGTTSAMIEFVEKKVNVYHIPINKEIDIYSNKIWKKIKYKEKKNVFMYNKLKNGNLVNLSNKKYSLKKINII